MNKKTVTCSECHHKTTLDTDKLAAEQDDKEIARMIADQELIILRCDHCHKETGTFFAPRLLMPGYVGIITYMPPTRIDDEAFIKEVSRIKSSKTLDTLQFVFSLEELKNQAKLWTKILNLRHPDDYTSSEFTGGG